MFLDAGVVMQHVESCISYGSNTSNYKYTELFPLEGNKVEDNFVPRRYHLKEDGKFVVKISTFVLQSPYGLNTLFPTATQDEEVRP